MDGLKYTHYEKRDGIAFIEINDPATMNAVSALTTGPELITCFMEANLDKEVRAVLLRGANGHFSAGGDLKAMKKKMDAGDYEIRNSISLLGDLVRTIRYTEKPVVALIEGSAAGGGLSLALACDYIIAAEDAKLVFAFINIGFGPDMGISLFLPRTVGKTKASELFMLGKRFTGEEAKEWGIINQTGKAEDVENEAMKIVHRFAEGPTLAYAATKKLINRTLLFGLDDCIRLEVESQQLLNKTADHKIAVEAFFEKKKPVFAGE